MAKDKKRIGDYEFCKLWNSDKVKTIDSMVESIKEDGYKEMSKQGVILRKKQYVEAGIPLKKLERGGRNAFDADLLKQQLEADGLVPAAGVPLEKLATASSATKKGRK
jgi:hypothetical protein